jgi:hypothetical protein
MQRKTFKLFAGKNSPPYLCTPQKREFIRGLADGSEHPDTIGRVGGSKN